MTDVTALPVGGYNPLRWDCNTSGCFNQKKRPKIEVFSECFPGRINFGDVDAIVEIGGQFLLLEWKEFTAELPTGQRIMYRRLTGDEHFVVLVVVGDAETMAVEGIQAWEKGRAKPFEALDLAGLKRRIRSWAKASGARAAA